MSAFLSRWRTRDSSLASCNMAEENHHGLHLVMFPWLAFGHIIPFLELSKSLAQRGHRISFVSTPRNIQRLPKLPPDVAPLIDFVNLTLPRPLDGNLPENAEATIDLPLDKIPYLKQAFDCLEGPLSRFLESSAPDWIIYDFAPHWLPPIASKLKIPCAFFSIFNAAALVFFGRSSLMNLEDKRTAPEHFTVPPDWIPFPSNLAYRLHEVGAMFNISIQNISGVTDKFRFASTAQACNVFALRSCREFEGQWLRLLEEDILKKPVIPVGLLPPSVKVSSDDDKNEKWVLIGEWLDEREKGSLVYVALGSEAIPSQEQVNELALGLELSELPFIWALRRPAGSTEDESFSLPDGFEERTKGRGMVCRGWAPQLRILAHPSVGGFLTHCGWGSTIEAMQFERPLVLLPLAIDQGLNARVLEEKKMGLEIPRDERTGWFTKESVAQSLRLVMVEEGGEIYRAKAKEMRELFGDKELHGLYIDDFAGYLKSHRYAPDVQKMTPETSTHNKI